MQKFCLKKAGQLHSVLRCGNIYFRGFVSSGQLLKKGLEMRLKHQKIFYSLFSDMSIFQLEKPATKTLQIDLYLL